MSPQRRIRCLLAMISALCLPASARADLSDIEGVWSGVCVDANGTSEVKGEVCFRGEGDAREVSLWGGAFRFLFKMNEVKSSDGGGTSLELTSFHWDQKAGVLRFDRERIQWSSSKNEPATVVHRSQELRLVAADSMDEPASESTSRGASPPTETKFRCTLRRESRKVAGGCPNCCPLSARRSEKKK